MAAPLEKAISELRALPQAEQDAVAEFVMEVIAERKFDQLIESEASIRLLEKMADAALTEHREGKTLDLDEICR
jgi:hypothetical protein